MIPLVVLYTYRRETRDGCSRDFEEMVELAVDQSDSPLRKALVQWRRVPPSDVTAIQAI
jgi:hypothetical protein